MTTEMEMRSEEAEVLNKLPIFWDRAFKEIHKRIIGQDELISQVLAAMLCRGHCLLIGVPGLAKTLLVKTIAEVADFSFNRVQFTPDMMPSDITGSEILEEDPFTKQYKFQFVEGPVFTQLLLADEINRTPPKTQSALLEAMQEHRVTVAGKTYPLEEPFFVLATQNPIEQEGAYPLPEAQLDRFMFSLNVPYPEFDDEVRILTETTCDQDQPVDKVLTAEDIIKLQHAVRKIHVPNSVARYIARLTRSTRPDDPNSGDFTRRFVRWGAGPRASQYLALAGKVFAVLDGRFNVAVEDIREAAFPVLRHRVLLNYHAEADNIKVDHLITKLLKDAL